MTRKMHPNSLANLQRGNKYTTTDGRAREAAIKTNKKRHERAEVKARLEAVLDDFADIMTDNLTFDEFLKLAKNADNQLVRALAREATDSKKAFALIQWIFDRYCGKATQPVDNNVNANVNVVKPSIVFADIAAEEKRMLEEEATEL